MLPVCGGGRSVVVAVLVSPLMCVRAAAVKYYGFAKKIKGGRCRKGLTVQCLRKK